MDSQARKESSAIPGSDNTKVPQVLPPELWHQVLDCLVQTPNGHQPVAFESAHVVTRTLHALTLVCRSIHPIASKYLYSHCVFVDRGRFQLFQSALAEQTRARFNSNLDLENSNSISSHDDPGKMPIPGQDNVAYITSCILDFDKSSQVDFVLSTIGHNLKRLVLDADPACFNFLEDDTRKIPKDILSSMNSLQELIISTMMASQLERPPPNLKRLALAGPPRTSGFVRHCISQESLEMLVTERRTTMGIMYASYAQHGSGIDLVLAAENTNHLPLTKLEANFISPLVRVWEVDIPRSFYGDDDHDGLLYSEWLWMHAKQGTLWTQDKRRCDVPEVKRMF